MQEALAKETELRTLAEKAQHEAEEMRIEATRKLYHSLLSQARLTRVTRKPGFRAQTETLLTQAARLDTDAVDPLEMRNEAIVAMLSPWSEDFIPVTKISREKNPQHGAFNQPFDEAAFLDPAKTLTLFQLDPKGVESSSWTLESGPVVDFAFAPSGNYLVTGHEDRMIRVWQRQTGGQWALSNEISWLNQAASSGIIRGDIAVKKDGFVLLERGTPHVHHWRRFSDSNPTTHLLPEIPDRRGDSLHASLSPDGRLLLIPSSGSTSVTLWDLQENKQLSKLADGYSETGHGGHSQTQFSPDGNFIAIASMVTLDILDAHSGELVFSRHYQGGVVTASFSPDSKRLVFGLNDSHILHLDTLSLDHSLAHQPGYFAFSGREAGLYQLFPRLNVNYGKINFLPENTAELRLLTGHEMGVREVTFAPNSKTLLSSSFDSSIRQWKLTDPDPHPILVDKSQHSPGDISFSPDGNTFATVIRNPKGTISIRDATTTRILQQFDLGAPAFGVAFDSKGTSLAVGGEDTLKVWHCELATSTSDSSPYHVRLMYELVEKDLGWISEVKFSPGGQYLAFNPHEFNRPTDEWIHIIDLKSSERLPNRIKAMHQWRTFDFVSDTQLAIIGTTRDLELWQFRTGELEGTIEIPSQKQRLWRLGVSNDRRYIAFHDGRAYLSAFDLRSKQTLFSAPILPHSLTLTALRWSPDSQILALTGSDKTIRILNLPLIRKRLADLDLDWNDSKHRE